MCKYNPEKKVLSENPSPWRQNQKHNYYLAELSDDVDSETAVFGLYS